MKTIAENAALDLSRLRWTAPERDAVALLDGPGVYQLYLEVSRPLRLEIGRLGACDFPAGLYIYTGSALRGLRQRLDRHLRSEKRHHWHIDSLLDNAQVRAIATLQTTERLECALHRLTLERLNGQIVIARFGSSDCRCAAHLIYLGAQELEDVIVRASAA